VDDRAVRFILDHELEHVEAGDLRLIITAGVLPVLFPWHLPLWWQLSRLRTAAEGDCDLRVLRRNPGQMKPYVDLLLQVGEMAPGRRPIAAMLSEPYETLKRRIKIMTMPFPKRPWLKGGLMAGVAVVMLGLACWAPGPTDAAKEELDAQIEESSPTQALAASGEIAPPTFTPYTVSPDIKNREEVAAALQRGYPAALKEEGIGGTVSVWFFVGEEGTVQNAQVNESSGYRELDEAALSMASVVEFTPALNRDRRVPVWVSLPVAFGVEPTSGSGGAREAIGTGTSRSAVQRTSDRPRTPVSRDPSEVGQIAGSAEDAASGAPLRYVQVFIGETGHGTLTNEDGRFLIEGVPAGDHMVEAILMGYGRNGHPARVRTGERANVEFQLQPQAVALTPFVVPGAPGRGQGEEGGGRTASLAVQDLRVAPTGREGFVVAAGTVVELETRNPVGAAEVGIRELDIGTLTNTDGQFVLNNIPSGDHIVYMRHPDLGEGTARVVVDRTPTLALEAPDVESPDPDPAPEPPATLPTLEGRSILSGTITEEGTEAPVGGARVGIPSLEIGAISNVQGRFLLLNAQPGTHTLLIEKDGFPPTEMEVVIQAGETTEVKLVLHR
jgi:TonB family protein